MYTPLCYWKPENIYWLQTIVDTIDYINIYTICKLIIMYAFIQSNSNLH